MVFPGCLCTCEVVGVHMTLRKDCQSLLKMEYREELPEKSVSKIHGIPLEIFRKLGQCRSHHRYWPRKSKIVMSLSLIKLWSILQSAYYGNHVHKLFTKYDITGKFGQILWRKPLKGYSFQNYVLPVISGIDLGQKPKIKDIDFPSP